LWLLSSTYYQVEAEVLEIHSGPFHWSVALSDIQSVRPSRSLLSAPAPALSLDRLELRCASGRQLLVSPRDRMGFLDAIGQAISKD
jgi:hypothetical protein